MKLSLLLPAALFAGAALTAAPIQRDLGRGLVYWRVHAVPEELPPVGSAGRHPWVLDVRYVSGDAAAGAALLAWLKAEAGPHSPVFLLANPATSDALLAPLDSPDAVRGLIILGPKAPDFPLPDIAVSVPPATERRAYDALERGAPIDSLLTDRRDKPREDEAMLDREHLSDSALGDDDDNTPAAPYPPAPLIDAVLQRAVQLHRALLALKRL